MIRWGWSMSRRATLFLSTSLSWLAMTMANVAFGADCVSTNRATSIDSSAHGTKVRTRDYQCDKEGLARLSVRFDRMTSRTASLLLGNHAVAPLRREFSRMKFVPNEVSAEFDRLVAQFGEIDGEIPGAIWLTVKAAGDGGEGQADLQSVPSTKVLVPSLGGWIGWDFPDPDALSSLTSVSTVPPGYTAVKVDDPNVRRIWRYMSPADLGNYAAQVSRYNAIVTTGNLAGTRDPIKAANIPAYIRLYRHLAAGGWPNDFIAIFGDRDIESSCAFRKYWEFKFFPRELLVDIVTVQNRGDKPIVIGGLIGAAVGGAQLRQPLSGLPVERSRLQFAQPVQLDPGQQMSTAVRLTWAVSDGFETQFSLAPSGAPARTPYAWGKEIRVAGVTVDGQALTLEGGLANFLAITTSSGGGSCPYLHAWSPGTGWRNTGKVIDRASGQSAQMSEERRFPGLVTRYKLVESEAERARIDGVSLTLEFESGKRLTLRPRKEALKSVDGRYVELAMGESEEIRFDLPGSAKKRKVMSSVLNVNGYYERYSDLLAERYGPPLQLSSIAGWSVAAARESLPLLACSRPWR